jgi:hypothetical protein
MSAMNQADHVVRHRGGVRWLDTRAMEWEPMPSLPGYFQKVLVRAEDGEPSATLNYVPSNRMLADAAYPLPVRHMHRSVRELTYLLEGEFKNCEYESPEQAAGDRIRKKKGYFMDRKPGSIHGREEAVASTGAVFINWREGGSGIWVGERDFDTVTVDVRYGDGAGFTPSADAPHETGAACVRNRGGVTLVDTRELEWQPMAALPGYFEKVLVRDADGEPSVTLNYLPAGGKRSFGLPYRHLHRTVREFCFVLEGSYCSWEYESAEAKGDLVWKRAGYFMERQPGSIHGREAVEPASATGAVLLNWRVGGSGVWFGERNFDTETVEIPYD